MRKKLLLLTIFVVLMAFLPLLSYLAESPAEEPAVSAVAQISAALEKPILVIRQ